MAALAIPFRRRMTLLGGHLCFHIGMADQAQVGPLGEQQCAELRLVWVVALAALPVGNRQMLTRGISHLLFKIVMTAEAEEFLRF